MCFSSLKYIHIQAGKYLWKGYLVTLSPKSFDVLRQSWSWELRGGLRGGRGRGKGHVTSRCDAMSWEEELNGNIPPHTHLEAVMFCWSLFFLFVMLLWTCVSLSFSLSPNSFSPIQTKSRSDFGSGPECDNLWTNRGFFSTLIFLSFDFLFSFCL